VTRTRTLIILPPLLHHHFCDGVSWFFLIRSDEKSKNVSPNLHLFPMQNANKTKRGITCTTQALHRINRQIGDYFKELMLLTDTCCNKLFSSIREELSILHRLSHSVALLDLIVTFTDFATSFDGCTRPIIAKSSSPFVLKQARHPVIEKVFSNFVPLDAFYMVSLSLCFVLLFWTLSFTLTLSLPLTWYLCAYVSCCIFVCQQKDKINTQAIILTGPNCSGKSTTLQTIASITILAHCGCFVPAAYANVPLIDRLFTRIGTSDDIESNASTFLCEMKETSYILNRCTSNSLILVDELGRGTSSDEGFAIAWAVSEHILRAESLVLASDFLIRFQTTSILLFFRKEYLILKCTASIQMIIATHFHQLCELPNLYPLVKNMHLKVIETDDSIK
jgi:DNA mismatch repair protein MSH4